MMATNISKLKSSKGAPPPADDMSDVIDTNTRDDDKAPTRPLQVRVAESVFAEFSEQGVRLHPWRKEAALPEDVESIQSAKHESMIACNARAAFPEKALSHQ
jgi:hypothetical protein